jgi:hypothetical protein
MAERKDGSGPVTPGISGASISPTRTKWTNEDVPKSIDEYPVFGEAPPWPDLL